jgi:hypothetical protein
LYSDDKPPFYTNYAVLVFKVNYFFVLIRSVKKLGTSKIFR